MPAKGVRSVMSVTGPLNAGAQHTGTQHTGTQHTGTRHTGTRHADVVVAGGGVIGTAIAWRAAAAGLDVILVDPQAGDGASLVAAGMLAPVSEALFGEDALLRLNLLAVRRFPAFAAELEELTGQQVGLRREGTLAVAHDAGDHAALLRLVAFRRSLGLDAEELDGLECRALEPFLAPACGAARCSRATGRWTTGGTRRRSGGGRGGRGAGGARPGGRGPGPRRPGLRRRAGRR